MSHLDRLTARLRQAGDGQPWLRGPGRRQAWRRYVVRRSLALTCALGVVFGAISLAQAPQQRPLTPVVVAARPMAVGELATPASVRQVLWPAELVPQGAVRHLAEVLGQTITSPLSSGDPVTQARLRGHSLLAERPADEVAIHVSLADANATAMLSAGDRVDLLGPAGPVASGVTVLQVDRSAKTDAGAVIQGEGSSSGYAPDSAGVVVAARQSVAQAIAAVPPDALGRPNLTVVLRSPCPHSKDTQWLAGDWCAQSGAGDR